MRRAFQRCSASIPQALSSSIAIGVAQRSLRLHASARRTTQILTGASIRALHNSSSILQQAASAQEAPASPIEGTPAPVTRFQELEDRRIVHPNVVRTITSDMKLETMTDVQSRTINEAIKGNDIIAQARTGTGKTLAFLIPLLQNIINVDPELARRNSSRRGPRTTADDIRALIVSPTRELAEQIATEARRLVSGTSVIVQTAVGGTQKSAGLRAIQRDGCHILVGTPGRLKDILSDPYTRVEAPDLSALVFDEADRLLDQGFWPEIQEIMRLLPDPAEKERQTLMFSATVPKDVVDLVRRTLKPGFDFVQCIGEDDEPTHARVPQRIVTTKSFENSIPALVELCNREIEKRRETGETPFKAIVYFPSTAEVTLAASALKGLQLPSTGEPVKASNGFASPFGSRKNHPWRDTLVLDIHSKLTQQARTRAADDFRRCKSGILLSSDVTARGMDFPNVTHVIQLGLPSTSEQYIHRIGRTARAGKEGEGWIIVNDVEMREARQLLGKFPIKRDESLETAALDLSQEARVSANAGSVLSMVQQAMRGVSAGDKVKVYMALLGVNQRLGNKVQIIEKMNNLAKFGWGMSQPPAISPGLAQKLGISRIPGVRIGHESYEESGGRDGRSGGRRGLSDRGSSYGGRDSFSDMGGRGASGGRRDFGGRGGSGGRGGFGGGRGGFGGRGNSGGRGDYGGRSEGYGERSRDPPSF